MDGEFNGRRRSLLSGLGKMGAFSARLSDKSRSVLGGVRIHISTAAVQILYAGFQVLASAALSDGISRYVFPVYRNAIAALALAPFAFFLDREQRRPLTLLKLSQFFVCGLIGVCINQTLFLAGLYYTSATFASTVQNLIPVLTFGMAASLGIEKIHIKRREGQAKALGIATCVGGAILIALYRGPSVVTVEGTIIRSSIVSLIHVPFDTSSFISWQLGMLCLFGNCITWAIWFILQTPVLRDYPAQLSVTTFTYALGALQLAVIAVCTERDPATWASTFLSDLPAVFYGGLVASGLAMTLQGWCAREGGPVLVASYQPLQTVLVAVLSSLFLRETFYLGSLLGGFLIVIGLYLVVWGKSREQRLEVIAAESDNDSSCDPPLICSLDVAEVLEEPLLGRRSSADGS